MTPAHTRKIHEIAATEARFVMGAEESYHDAMYRAITGLLYQIFEVLHPEDPFPSLAEVEFEDSGISVEFYWDGELMIDHATMMTFCKARKCTLAQIRQAFKAHDYTPDKLREEEEKLMERHNKGAILATNGTTPRLNLKRQTRKVW